MTTRQLVALAITIIIIVSVVLYFRTPSREEPLASVTYACNGGKSMLVRYYRGEAKPAATADLPPTLTGKVELALSDGRSMTLPQTVSADGGRYANADESFVFWTKGNGALVLEDNQQKSFIGCILIAPQPEDTNLTLVYANGGNGFSIRMPQGYAVDESYRYEGLGPNREIAGIKLTIPESLAAGTNLGSDSYVSVEGIPQTASCTADLFLDRPGRLQTLIDNDVQYTVASSTGAAAGNRYDETVFALFGTNPCIAVRYFVHYGAIENYLGSVQSFDESALIREFDAIRRTLVINQQP